MHFCREVFASICITLINLCRTFYLKHVICLGVKISSQSEYIKGLWQTLPVDLSKRDVFSFTLPSKHVSAVQVIVVIYGWISYLQETMFILNHPLHLISGIVVSKNDIDSQQKAGSCFALVGLFCSPSFIHSFACPDMLIHNCQWNFIKLSRSLYTAWSHITIKLCRDLQHNHRGLTFYLIQIEVCCLFGAFIQ